MDIQCISIILNIMNQIIDVSHIIMGWAVGKCPKFKVVIREAGKYTKPKKAYFPPPKMGVV